MIRRFLDKMRPHFEEKGSCRLLFPLFEAIDTFIYTPGNVTRGAAHIRDGLDLKRMMTIVVVALHSLHVHGDVEHGISGPSGDGADGVRNVAGLARCGHVVAGPELLASEAFFSCLIHGALYFLPVYVVTLVGRWRLGSVVCHGSRSTRSTRGSWSPVPCFP